MWGFFYFYNMAKDPTKVDLEFLKSIKENVVSKGYNAVDITTLRYYYKKIYSSELNVSCSSCIIDAFIQIKKYYATHISKHNIEDTEVVKAKIFQLKQSLIHFEKQSKYEICGWIKERIKHHESTL